jgi:hypothetical protein
MPSKVQKRVAAEYKKKGYSAKRANSIGYAVEAKQKKRRKRKGK